jgi:hypothetical protein
MIWVQKGLQTVIVAVHRLATQEQRVASIAVVGEFSRNKHSRTLCRRGRLFPRWGVLSDQQLQCVLPRAQVAVKLALQSNVMGKASV